MRDASKSQGIDVGETVKERGERWPQVAGNCAGMGSVAKREACLDDPI
jgi:hypothetical protein